MSSQLPSPGSPTGTTQPKFQYRSTVGVGLNMGHNRSSGTPNPLKNMFSNTSSPMQFQGMLRRDSAKLDTGLNGNVDGIYEEEDDQLRQQQRWDRVDHLFSQCDEVQRTIELKLQKLGEIHDDLSEIGMSLVKSSYPQDQQESYIHQQRTYLPTPEDDEFTNRYQGPVHDHADVPSSPESYTSQTSQLEIDINEQISRMVQRDPYNSRDIMKLKGAATNMIELMRYEVQDEDGIIKLMNLNDDVHMRSERVISSFGKLLDSFSTS